MILQAKQIDFSYGTNQVLKGVSAEFDTGKLYSIMGSSGSGKTTLLSLLSGIDTPDSGQILYHGRPLQAARLGRYRKEISIVFQAYNLIPYMNALQNVLVALDIIGTKGDRRSTAVCSLESVGLDPVSMRQKVVNMSGGQQQRVAIARALAKGSTIIFADEPTGNLDSHTTASIINLLRHVAYKNNCCVICATHDKSLANQSDKVFTLNRGQLR